MRAWHTAKALESVRELEKVLNQLTMDEVLHCLKLEVDTTRRRTIVDRLISRAAELNKEQFTAALREKLFGEKIINPLKEK